MRLDEATAERLAMDAALGQLPEDARALWQAYLDEHGDLAARARRDADAVALARTALAERSDSGPAALGPLPPLTWPARRGRRWRPVAWAAAVAAGMVVGAAMGWHAAPRVPAGPAGQVTQVHQAVPAPTPPPACAAAPAPAAIRTDEPDGGFWSARRLRLQVRADAAEPAERKRTLTWKSPVKLPALGDEL